VIAVNIMIDSKNEDEKNIKMRLYGTNSKLVLNIFFSVVNMFNTVNGKQAKAQNPFNWCVYIQD